MSALGRRCARITAATSCRGGSQTRPSISIPGDTRLSEWSSFERAGLRPDNYMHILVEVCRARHRPASAEAMQEGYHCSNPHLQMGDLWQPDILLSPLQMRLPGRKGGVPRASLATRLKSGANIIRTIHISALKRGDSEEHTPGICVQLSGLRHRPYQATDRATIPRFPDS